MCKNVCAEGAITFEIDVEGFWYPVINTSKCIKCGVCLSKCPGNNSFDGALANSVYVAKSNNIQTRLESTSGGMFTEFAEVFFDENGSVSGSVYTEEWNAKHILANDRNSLSCLRKSKYMQSDMNTIYSQIKEELDSGKKVLFCGTPCQVVALHFYLGKDYEELYTLDFICRGVYSPGEYRRYLDDLVSEYGAPIKNVWVKNKEFGWHSLGIRIDFSNGQTYMRPALEDEFGKQYLINNRNIRPSCFSCDYKGGKRKSDITIGDFWGLDESELDDNLGLSAVIINSEKGERLFGHIKEKCTYKKMTIDDVIKGNPCYEQSVERKY